MQNFKVGDWVKDIQDEALYKIKEIKEFPEEPTYKRFIFSSTKETWIDIYNDEIDTDGWKPWQPKLGEWCWFWNFNEMPTLEQFSKYHNLDDHLGNYETLAVKLYQHCEPFIGELPTYLKDNT